MTSGRLAASKVLFDLAVVLIRAQRDRAIVVVVLPVLAPGQQTMTGE
jgi:hypothetical protein